LINIKSKDKYKRNKNIKASKTHTSPILLIINAFIAALFAAILVYQKFINK
jgi:hypothetical protein